MTINLFFRKHVLALAALLAVLAAALPFSAQTASAAPAMAICGTPKVVTLFAGQTIDAGTVTVGNDQDNLYVMFTSANGWLLGQTHLHVADSLASIPQTKSGNPKVGNFAYQSTHNPYVTSYTYAIPKSSLSLDANNSVVIAAHAVVVQVDGSGNVVANETGWASGNPFVSKGSWAMYLQYTWQSCDGGNGGSKTETAFARGSGTNDAGDDAVTCFLKIDSDFDGEFEFNRWGWTNGALEPGSYSFELWAGAGQCDTGKGTLVGTVNVNYDGSTATVTFSTTGVYQMVETHLYVGSEILARDVNGQYTVAPGQYPTIHGELSSGVQSDTYTVTGLSGKIYVVAHATVSGF